MTSGVTYGYRAGLDELEDTSVFFDSSLDHLKSKKVQNIFTKVRCEVETTSGGKVAVYLIAKVSQLRTQIIGFVPVASVGLGFCRVSVGLARLAMAAASIGTANLLGLSPSLAVDKAFVDAELIKQGFVNLLPLAAGALVLMKDATPSFDVMVTDFSVSSDRAGVVKHYVSQAATKAFAEDERLSHLRPESRSIIQFCEKTFSLVSEGASIVVTCAAWGDIVMGVGALAAAPMTSGSTLPYAVTSIAKGTFSLTASSILDLVEKYEVKEKVMSWISGFFHEEKDAEEEAFEREIAKAYAITKKTD